MLLMKDHSEFKFLFYHDVYKMALSNGLSNFLDNSMNLVIKSTLLHQGTSRDYDLTKI